MKFIQRAIALSGLLLILTVSSVLGQSGRQTVTVNIPFNFTVGEKTLPAGEYVLQRNKRDSDTVWVIKNDNGAVAVFLTRPVRNNNTQQETSLVFHRYEDNYFLSEFWTAGSNTGREINVSDSERGLDKALAAKRQEHILIGQGK